MTTSSKDSSQNPVQDQPKLMLIDGHSLAFRSFYGTPVDSFRNSAGQHTNAVHGFLSTLIRLIRDERPSHIIVAFDLPGGTFRTQEYGEYKGGRSETPQEFYGQVELIQRLLEALAIPAVTFENYEADDIVATYARQGREAGYLVQIVSGDRDAFQLVTDQVTLLYPVTTGPTKGIRYMTPAAVEEKYKVPPHLYPDLAALTGEQADNLPGVPGVGPGFAAKWINEYGDLQGVLANADKIKGKKGEALREHVEDVLRNRRLNHLVDDLDLPLGLEAAGNYGPQQPELDQLFEELEFRSIRKRLDEVLGEAGGAVAQLDLTMDQTLILSSGSELEDFLAQAPAALADRGEGDSLPQRLERALTLLPLVAEDKALESAGHARPLEGLLLLAGKTSSYLPLPQEAESSLGQALATWLADARAPKIIFDLKQNLKDFALAGYRLEGVVEDILLSSYVCGHTPTARRRGQEEMMQDLSQAYLNLTYPTAPEEVDQGELFSLDSQPDLEYLALAGRYQQEVAYALASDLADKEQLDLYQSIELPLAASLASMEEAGIALDGQALKQLADYYGQQVDQAKQAAHALVEQDINLSSPKQLQVVLFDQLKLPPTRKLKSGFSTDAESLSDILSQVEPDSTGALFLGQLQTYRDFTKLKQTVEGLAKATSSQGRVHTTYQQNAAATGRLSSTDPNLQNIPIRTPEGRKIREAFVVAPQPLEGVDYSQLLTADYSQIEMRIMVHLAQDQDLIRAYQEGEDLHRFVGSQVFGVEPEDVTAEMRAKVKAMSYGLAYGLSPFGLSKQLKISVDEAFDLRKLYFDRFGKIQSFLRKIVRQAHRDGYTQTMFGRRRYLPDLASSNRQRREAAERAALNSPIQGTAADIIKIAMLRVDQVLRQEGLKSRILLQVHDELILEVARGEEETVQQILTQQMSQAAQLSVPLEVQVGWGSSWYQAGH